jgi:glutamate racemase
MACALYDLGEEDFSSDVFSPIAPTAKAAIKKSKQGRIGILGDTAVVTSGVFQGLIKNLSPETKAFSHASPLLSHLVKEGMDTKPEAIRMLKKYLFPLKVRQVDSLILGSSWYYSIYNIIGNKAGRRIHIVDSAKILTDSMMMLVNRRPELDQILKKTGKFQCYVTDITEKASALAKRMYRGNLSLLRG